MYGGLYKEWMATEMTCVLGEQQLGKRLLHSRDGNLIEWFD